MTNRRHKVLLIIPNLGSGGAQRVFHQHLKLLRHEFDVVGCAFNFDGAFSHELNSGIMSLDVPAGQNPIDKVLRFFERVRKLKLLKKKLNIDVSVSHLEGADYVNILSKTADKVILWIHGTKTHDQNISGFTGWLRKNILIPRWYSRADRIVCVSNRIAEELSSLNISPDKKIVAVHNGVDVNSIQQKAKESLMGSWPELFGGHNVIVTHCRLAAQKNLVSLIDIIAKLRDVQSLRWLIVGDGEERQLLIDRCKQHNIPTYDVWNAKEWTADCRVYFAGEQQNPFPLISNGTIYIQISKWEGFPLSLCEALACGLPVIASDCFTGPREIIAPEIEQPVSVPTHASAGILMPVPSHDNAASIDLWVNEIRKIIHDTSLLNNYHKKAYEQSGRFSEDVFQRESIRQILSTIQ